MKTLTLFILMIITLSSAQDWNCETPSGAILGTCTFCFSGFFIGAGGVCTVLPAGSNCANYSMITGNCVTCWSNDVIINGVCVPVTFATTTMVQNPNCAT